MNWLRKRLRAWLGIDDLVLFSVQTRKMVTATDHPKQRRRIASTLAEIRRAAPDVSQDEPEDAA